MLQEILVLKIDTRDQNKTTLKNVCHSVHCYTQKVTLGIHLALELGVGDTTDTQC